MSASELYNKEIALKQSKRLTNVLAMRMTLEQDNQNNEVSQSEMSPTT